MASAGAAARRYARMFHARVLSFTVAPSGAPRSSSGRRRQARRRPGACRTWLGRRRRGLVPREG